MAQHRRRTRFHPEKLARFLEAAYRLEEDDQTWLADVLGSAQEMWGRGVPCYAATADVSDVNAFRLEQMHAIDVPDAALALLRDGVDRFTPTFVARTFLSIGVSLARKLSMPELRPMFDGLERVGFSDAFGIRGLDPTGAMVFLAFLMPTSTEPPPAEKDVYRRMAHHLGAAQRYRRRLRASQPGPSAPDPSEGAEAILDARRRVVHAVGPAKSKAFRQALVTASKARDLAHTTTKSAQQGLRRWSPLTGARWTLVDSFERSGARYVVARENLADVRGLTLLTERERQIVALLALRASTKEIAYTLGISDTTVRVLLARSATKLGVRSRAALLSHPDLAGIRPKSTVYRQR
jgi:DNA-binding CsgD family transcriptional regulator